MLSLEKLIIVTPVDATTLDHHFVTSQQMMMRMNLIGGISHRQASNEAYHHAFNYVRKHIIASSTLVCVGLLRDKYLDYILAAAPQFFNEQFKTHMLKGRLISEFDNQLQFWQTPRKSEIVFRSDIDVEDALAMAYEASSSLR